MHAISIYYCRSHVLKILFPDAALCMSYSPENYVCYYDAQKYAPCVLLQGQISQHHGGETA